VALLYSYLHKYRALILLALVLAATNQVFSLLDPLLFRHVIDSYAMRFREYTTGAFIRGAGLLLGIVLTEPLAPQVRAAAQEAGFLVNAPAPDVVRLMPPLNLGDDEAEAFLEALPGILDAVNGDRSGE
jgi:acetylornithine/succinyldiaminopimelate/putrescine aminotransferase